MTIKICLAGATGHVGQELVKGIMAGDDLTLAAAVGGASAGKMLDQVLDYDGPGLRIAPSVAKANKATDFSILIDYTTPMVVYANVVSAIELGVHCVIGTSGLSDEQYQDIDSLARENGVGVSAAGNFSVTAALMQHFAVIAAKYVPHWELFDYAPDTKADAPSGTTRELAYLLSQVGRPRYAINPEDVHGLKDSRGATLNGTQVHSVRVPGFYSSSEAMFGLPGERLSIRHDSISYRPYVEGTLLTARQVHAHTGLIRGLNNILGL